MDRSTRLVGECLRTDRMADGTRKLLRDLEYRVEGELVKVPAGTRTDFSTIPWPGRFLVEWNKVDLAGVIHDYLYQTGITDRAWADQAWRRVAMSGDHCANAAQAWIGWAVLRLGGWSAWRAWQVHRQQQHGGPPEEEPAS